MNYKFFANSQKTWQAMFSSISSAQKSVYLEMYIFQEDMVEFDFLKLLKEKAMSGVVVKIILDSFGSHSLSKKTILEIKEAGIDILFLSYFLHRTHRKILVVDESVAFIGGVNFYQSSSLWNDLVVQIKSKNLVLSILRSFAKAYVESGGTDHSVIEKSIKQKKNYRNNKLSEGGQDKQDKAKVRLRDWLIEHSPVKNKFNLKKIYSKHLLDAKEDITLVTPYFMPRRWLIGLLHQAVLRGVKVQILIPEISNEYVADRINYFYMLKLSPLGINFCIESKMNHAKIMTIDSKEAIVGSNNLDYLSFELNSEIGIFFNNQDALGRISKIIEGWKKDSVLFDIKMYKSRWFDYILFPIIRVLLIVRIL